tara:strand:- start:3544 stop:4365 length:822 start_codon:yes stop_codon:yes gene_type:complete
MGINIKSFKQFNESISTDVIYDGWDRGFDENELYSVALHRITKYPIYVFRGYLEEDGHLTTEEFEDLYTAIKLPNGNYLSHEGEVTSKEIEDFFYQEGNYENIDLVEITESESMSLYDAYNSYDVDQVKRLTMLRERTIKKYIDYINEKLGLQLALKINENIDKSIYSNWSIKKGNDSDFSNVEFITLYRAEGTVVSDRSKLPKAMQGSSGSWFSPNLEEAERYSKMNSHRKIYKLDIPLTLYNNLSNLSKGMEMSKGEVRLPLDLATLKTLL